MVLAVGFFQTAADGSEQIDRRFQQIRPGRYFGVFGGVKRPLAFQQTEEVNGVLVEREGADFIGLPGMTGRFVQGFTLFPGQPDFSQGVFHVMDGLNDGLTIALDHFFISRLGLANGGVILPARENGL